MEHAVDYFFTIKFSISNLISITLVVMMSSDWILVVQFAGQKLATTYTKINS